MTAEMEYYDQFKAESDSKPGTYVYLQSFDGGGYSLDEPNRCWKVPQAIANNGQFAFDWVTELARALAPTGNVIPCKAMRLQMLTVDEDGGCETGDSIGIYSGLEVESITLYDVDEDGVNSEEIDLAGQSDLEALIEAYDLRDCRFECKFTDGRYGFHDGGDQWANEQAKQFVDMLVCPTDKVPGGLKMLREAVPHFKCHGSIVIFNEPFKYVDFTEAGLRERSYKVAAVTDELPF